MWWSSGSGRIELQLTQEHVDCGYHTGQCDEDIAFLRREPEIKAQLEKLDPELIRSELRECGAWDDDDLADHEANLDRLLWLACGDMHDEPERFED